MRRENAISELVYHVIRICLTESGFSIRLSVPSCEEIILDFFEGYIEFNRNIAVGEQGKLIKDDDFAIFFTENGKDRALGYLQAMNDFTSYAEVILGGGYCRNGVLETSHIVRKHLMELTDHNNAFLTKFSDSFDLHL